MRYKFVDIGSSFFDTSVETFGLDEFGLLIEPIKEAYDLLPFSDKVKRVNVAISDYNGTGNLLVPENLNIPQKYMTKEDVRNSDINEFNFGQKYAVACSTLQDKHTLLDRLNIKQKKIECQVITFYALCEQYDISEIDYLKIDIEGHEHVVLKQILDLMDNGKLSINQLVFEYNEHSDKQVLDGYIETISTKFGFNVEFISKEWNEDVVLTKNNE